jgi:molybdopterin-guanine dinucleotide biosynthesis protein A
MGQDKSWLKCGHEVLIQRQVQIVQRLEPLELFISGPAGTRLESLGWPLLADTFPGQGPLAGIERALEVMKSPLLLTVAVDMPRLSSALLRKMLMHCKETVGVVPRTSFGVEPLAAIYPKGAHRAVLTLLGNGTNSATWFAELCVELGLAEFLDLKNAGEEFTNWNSPADVKFGASE